MTFNLATVAAENSPGAGSIEPGEIVLRSSCRDWRSRWFTAIACKYEQYPSRGLGRKCS
jgi:hypothetical protein